MPYTTEDLQEDIENARQDLQESSKIARNSYGHGSDATTLELLESRVAPLLAANERLEAALKTILGTLDDPTGGSHITDMRQASATARDALAQTEGIADD